VTPDGFAGRASADGTVSFEGDDLPGGTFSPAGDDLPGGPVAVAFDGRLSNLDALRAQLGLAPDAGAATAVAAGFERWGDALPARLRGEFACAVWDRRSRRGLLARDQLGAAGMFFARQGGALLFASEVAPLLDLLPTRPAPDELAVAHWLSRTAAPGDGTLHAGVRRLRPGHALALGVAGAEPRPYWTPEYSPPPPRARGEVVEALRAAMTAAVARALDGAAAPGVLLSGGFDSAGIAALAAGPPHAFSMTFPDHPEIDESARIDAVAQAVGLHVTRARFAGGSALAAAAEHLEAWALPPASPNRFVWAPLLRGAAESGTDVLLAGDGGDELLGCSPYLVADRLRSGHPLAALALTRRLPGMGSRPPAHRLRRGLVQYGLRGALPPGLHGALRRARRSQPAAARLRPDLAALHADSHDPWAWKRRPGPRWWAWLSHVLTTGADELGVPDHQRREARLAGLALRHPYRDPDLVETVLTLPPEAAFDPHLDRPAARDALAGRLPDAVRLDDRKPHYNRVLVESLRADGAVARALLEGSGVECAAYLDPAALRGVRDALEAGSGPTGWEVDAWRVLTLEQWLRSRLRL
jgi:asparagine synthase (glutamine-hydrolysing)